MENTLIGKKVAILATDGFEQSELQEPLLALTNVKAEVDIISIKKGKIKAWKDKDWSIEVSVTKTLDEVSSNDYDALILPGGVMNPDTLRTNEAAIKFVTGFLIEGKPIAAICHGPWTLIETGLLEGRKMTSYKSLKTDLINAGVMWVDEEVVTDNGLVTSRNPKDLPAFCKKIVEEIKEGVHLKIV